MLAEIAKTLNKPLPWVLEKLELDHLVSTLNEKLRNGELPLSLVALLVELPDTLQEDFAEIYHPSKHKFFEGFKNKILNAIDRNNDGE